MTFMVNIHQVHSVWLYKFTPLFIRNNGVCLLTLLVAAGFHIKVLADFWLKYITRHLLFILNFHSV